MNNKGFSLVELIIVIAIMAILAAALAPQLIKYLEESRISTDNSACDTIKSCFNAAITNEKAYKEVTGKTVASGVTLSTKDDISCASSELGKELASSLADLVAPKESGKNKYKITWDVTTDATSGQVSVTNIKVETIA